MSDLVCLVADKCMEAVVQALLDRPQALQIRRIEFVTYVHPQRDPGCYHSGVEYLREYHNSFSHGLLLLDWAWDGCPARTGEELLELIREKINDADLRDWGDAIVFHPELEVWLFTDSLHLAECLGWRSRRQQLRDWLRENDLWPDGSPKPPEPKRAIEAALFETRSPRSSAIYRDIADRSSVKNCTDRAFQLFRQTLQQWFPPL